MTKGKLADLIAIEYPKLMDGYTYNSKCWTWHKDDVTYYIMAEIFRFLENNKDFVLIGGNGTNIKMIEMSKLIKKPPDK